MPNTPHSAAARSPHIVSLADHERHAQQHLNANAWAYFAGAPPTKSPCTNNQAWNQLPLAPRVLRPLAGGHTRIELLGRTWAHRCCWRPSPFSAWPTPMANWPAPTPPPRWCRAGAQHPGQRGAGNHCPGGAGRPRARAFVVPALPAARPGLHPRAGTARRGSGLRSPGAHRRCSHQRRARPRTPCRLSSAARHSRRQPGGLPPAPRPRSPAAKALCSMACCTTHPPGTMWRGCNPSPACRCCSKASCTRKTPAKLPPWAWRA